MRQNEVTIIYYERSVPQGNCLYYLRNRIELSQISNGTRAEFLAEIRENKVISYSKNYRLYVIRNTSYFVMYIIYKIEKGRYCRVAQLEAWIQFQYPANPARCRNLTERIRRGSKIVHLLLKVLKIGYNNINLYNMKNFCYKIQMNSFEFLYVELFTNVRFSMNTFSGGKSIFCLIVGRFSSGELSFCKYMYSFIIFSLDVSRGQFKISMFGKIGNIFSFVCTVRLQHVQNFHRLHITVKI